MFRQQLWQNVIWDRGLLSWVVSSPVNREIPDIMGISGSGPPSLHLLVLQVITLHLALLSGKSLINWVRIISHALWTHPHFLSFFIICGGTQYLPQSLSLSLSLSLAYGYSGKHLLVSFLGKELNKLSFKWCLNRQHCIINGNTHWEISFHVCATTEVIMELLCFNVLTFMFLCLSWELSPYQFTSIRRCQGENWQNPDEQVYIIL